jgi:hypothetical protein
MGILKFLWTALILSVLAIGAIVFGFWSNSYFLAFVDHFVQSGEAGLVVLVFGTALQAFLIMLVFGFVCWRLGKWNATT